MTKPVWSLGSGGIGLLQISDEEEQVDPGDLNLKNS
jgi:hypothetical protein